MKIYKYACLFISISSFACVDPSPSPIVQSAPKLSGIIVSGASATITFTSNAPNCTAAVGATQAAATYDWLANIPCTSAIATNIPVTGAKIWLRLYANYSTAISLAADYSFTAASPIAIPSPGLGIPFNPYASNSTWNQTLPVSPQLNTNSAAMIAGAFQNYAGKFYVNPPGAFPLFFTKSGDPTVTISLTLPYGASNLQGATVPIPKTAIPAPPGDAHLTVLNSANGNEYDYYQFPQNETITQGESISVGFGNITNYQNGTGWSSSTTASGASLLGGLVTTDEILSGTIHHALAMAPGCNNGAGSVFPATSVATYACPVSNGNGIPHGSRIWSDLAPAQIAPLNLDKISSMLLTALNQYGGFITDTNGWVAFDIRNIFETPISPAGTTYLQQNGAIQLNAEPASFFTAHLHVLAVCVTQGGC